jgi:hypothetical protein
MAQSSETLATSVAKARDIVLGAGPVQVALAPATGSSALAARLAAVKPGQKVYLVVKGLRASEHPPEITYQIYLGLPRGTAPTAESPHYVGSFNFFNAARPGQKADTRVQSFEVTSLVKTLQARKLLDDSAAVTLVPAGPPNPGAKPSVGEIALVAQ